MAREVVNMRQGGTVMSNGIADSVQTVLRELKKCHAR
jgi:hypothetical protein